MADKDYIVKPHADVVVNRNSFDNKGKLVTKKVTLSPCFEVVMSSGNSIVVTKEELLRLGFKMPVPRETPIVTTTPQHTV